VSEVGFAFVPSIVLLIILAGSAALVGLGAVGLTRGRDSLLKIIGVGALALGGLGLLALAASLLVGEPIRAFLLLAFLFVGVFGLLVWVAALMDCAMNEPSQGNEKIVWIIIIVFTHLLGALLYLLLRRPRRIAETGR
jgi:hypothetical protein